MMIFHMRRGHPNRPKLSKSLEVDETIFVCHLKLAIDAIVVVFDVISRMITIGVVELIAFSLKGQSI